MEIFLLRHATSTSNEQRLVCGAMDFPLSYHGRKQAKLVCKKLNKIRFTRIYSSPLKRALQTIEYLDRASETIIVKDLIEVDTGESSRMTVEELWYTEPKYRYQGLHPDLKYPGGECLRDMLKRVSSWYDKEILKWSSDDIVLIAGHEGTICGILHNVLSIPIHNYPTFHIGNCDCVKMTINQDMQVRYRFLNCIK